MLNHHETKQAAILKAFLFFGSRKELAKQINKNVKVIENWLNRGDNIPYEYAILIEHLTQGFVRLEELAPHSPVNKIIRRKIGVFTC